MFSDFPLVSARLLLALLFLLLPPSAAQAQALQALVLESLPQKTSDKPGYDDRTADVKSALSSRGYAVMELDVVNAGSMSWAVEVFAKRLRRAGPGTVGIVYVSTPGISDSGENYLLPTLPSSGEPLDAKASGYAVRDLLNMLEALDGIETGLVLDTCQDAVADGLAAGFTEPLPATAKVLVASCRPAADGSKGIRPISSAFAEAIASTDLSLATVFDRVNQAEAHPTDLQAILWNAIEGTDDRGLLEQYLTQFPDGRYVAAAKARLASMGSTKPAPREVAAPPTPPPAVQAMATVHRFSGTLTGTGAAGWANLYLAICGNNIRYKTSIEGRHGTWTAELVNLKNNDVVEFKQTTKTEKAGQVLLYGRYGLDSGSKNKVILQLTPRSDGRVALNIPNIGTCAVGQLN